MEDFLTTNSNKKWQQLISDHFPLTLNFGELSWGPIPFRFENSWPLHKDFKTVVDSWWIHNPISGWPGHGFMMKLKRLKFELLSWNKSLGSVTENLSTLISQLKTLDNIEDYDCLSTNQKVQRHLLQGQIEDITTREHIY